MTEEKKMFLKLRHILFLHMRATGELYDADGHCRDPFPTDSVAGLRSKPTPLMWEVDERLEALINRACVQAKKVRHVQKMPQFHLFHK